MTFNESKASLILSNCLKNLSIFVNSVKPRIIEYYSLGNLSFSSTSKTIIISLYERFNI